MRRKELRAFCESLQRLIGPFGFWTPEGNPVFVSPGHQGSAPSLHRSEVKVGGATVGYVTGPDGRVDAGAALLGIFLKEIDEKRALTTHTLHKYREINVLSEISEILGESIEIDEILSAATKRCSEILGAENCSVMLINEGDERLYIKSVSGRTVNEPSWLELSGGIAGRVIETGSPVIANSPRRHPDFAAGERELRSMLCVPLRVKDRTVGVLNVSNKSRGEFSSEDEALLVSVSAMIAGAIEASRLLEEKLRNERFATIGQMAAGIVHDIKNPMATIKGFAGLLGDLDFTPDERKEYSSMIISEIDRLVAMVEDLLAFSRGFKTKLSIKETDAGNYLTEITEFIRKDMETRDIRVILRAEYRGPLYIDPEKFKRAIYNISGNAKEAIHEGGLLLILARRLDDAVEMVFSDTGEGIPEEIMETLFEPFVTRGKRSGTGLGLAVTKRIVEEHGGSIIAVNGNYSGVEGFNGANFVIRLPLSREIQ